VALPDGSLLYANRYTAVTLTAAREINLISGEVFLEIDPRRDGSAGSFVVITADRRLSITGGKLGATCDNNRTTLLVVQGEAVVDRVSQPLRAGQMLAPGAEHGSPAPRVSRQLAWIKELMDAGEAPLVPPSKFAGGAITITNADGVEARLSLRRYHIDVHIEDGFARTTIDQTYFNHEDRRAEGTFQFPLPPDASLSRLAMYVDGKLMEGGMAEREYARDVFQQIMYSKRDPALLEWVDGSTFKMRVFPLEPRQEKRIILSYTQRLPSLEGRAEYRFPAGHTLQGVREWSFHARMKNAAKTAWQWSTHSLQASTDDDDLILNASAKNVNIDRDIVLDLFENGPLEKPGESVRFSSAEQDGKRYLMLRYRPVVDCQEQPKRRDWVFLYETTGDRSPLLARAQIEVIRGLLANAGLDDTFAVVAASTGVRTFAQELKPVTPGNIQAAVSFLESLKLIGALNLGNAFDAVQPMLHAARNPWLVHVGSGIAVLGQRNENTLQKKIPSSVPYLGIGVGKRWAPGFMKLAAERSGGYATQINPNECIAWRTFDLVNTLNVPRLLNLKVAGNAESDNFLTASRMLTQGEELCAVLRLAAGQRRFPVTVTITGTLNAKPFHRVLPVGDIAAHADYLPRTWAKLEIDRLLEQDATKNKEQIIALSKAMYVMTPFTSLIVLENEEMYKQFKVDRGRKDHWALYPCPQQISVTSEPLASAAPGLTAFDSPTRRPSRDEVLGSILVRMPPQFLKGSPSRDFQATTAGKTALELLEMAHALPVAIEDAANSQQLDFQRASGQNGLRLVDRSVNRREPAIAAEQVSNESSIWPSGLDGNSEAVGWPTRGSALPNGAMGIGGIGGIAGIGGGGGSNDLGMRTGGIAGLGGGSPINSAGAFGNWGGRRSAIAVNPAGDPGQEDQSDRTAGLRPSDWDALLKADGQRAPTRTHTSVKLEWFPSLHAKEHERRSSPFDGDIGNVVNIPGTMTANRSGTGDDIMTPAVFFRDSDFSPANRMLQSEVSGRSTLYDYVTSILRGENVNLSYERPAFSGDPRVFRDLVSYAPAMNTTMADILSVLEAEAGPEPEADRGSIEPAARGLIDKARGAGWQVLTVPAKARTPAWNIFFDGSGHYTYDRMLSSGLREQASCDGSELLHLYPELGIGARRQVTRFQQMQFAQWVPSYLPSADDLAHGADLLAIDSRTVAIMPHAQRRASNIADKPTKEVCVHLVFAGDGRLTERQLVNVASGNILFKETYSADGTVNRPTAAGKDLASFRLAVHSADAPDLALRTQELVVLPLPFRSREYLATRKIRMVDLDKLNDADALALIGTHLASDNLDDLYAVQRDHFGAQGDECLGFYTLRLVVGSDLPQCTGLDKKQCVLVEYLRRIVGKSVLSQWRARDHLAEGLLPRLAELHELRSMWSRDDFSQDSEALFEARCSRFLDYIGSCHCPQMAWALIDLLFQQELQSSGRRFHFFLRSREGFELFKRRGLAEFQRHYGDVPTLNYAAGYEFARSLVDSGERAQASKAFLEAYASILKADALPSVDEALKQAFEDDVVPPDWSALLYKRVGELTRANRILEAHLLAQQWSQLEQNRLAKRLSAHSWQDAPSPRARALALVLSAGLRQAHEEPVYTDELLQALPALDNASDNPSLLRLASAVARQQGNVTRSVAYLGRALEIEFRILPGRINVQEIRADYAALLAGYQELARMARALEMQPSRELSGQIVAAADRWRSLDPNNPDASRAAAQALRAAGVQEMAWEYFVTSLDGAPGANGAWSKLAEDLSIDGDLFLADQAYALASEEQPADPEILYDRALNLTRLGNREKANQLFERVAKGAWQPQYQWIQQEAQRRLGK